MRKEERRASETREGYKAKQTSFIFAYLLSPAQHTLPVSGLRFRFLASAFHFHPVGEADAFLLLLVDVVLEPVVLWVLPEGVCDVAAGADGRFLRIAGSHEGVIMD